MRFALFLAFLFGAGGTAFAADSQTIRFAAPGGVMLAGSYYRAPGSGRHPVVLLLAGSGKSTRDTVPFHTLERLFTNAGADVYAYDKRGAGESGGVYDYNAPLQSVADDALAAIKMLVARPEADPKRVGTFGISQGGMLGPLMASQSSDVAFVISVSGPGVSLAEQSIYFRGSQMVAQGFTAQDVEQMEAVRRILWAYYGTGLGREAAVAALASVKDKPWFAKSGMPATVATPETLDPSLRRFMQEAATYDPLATAKRVRVPTLIVFGGKDSAVPASQSLANLIDAYGSAPGARATFAYFPDGGHGLELVQGDRECHECAEKAMTSTGRWDAVPGFFDLVVSWLRDHVLR